MAAQAPARQWDSTILSIYLSKNLHYSVYNTYIILYPDNIVPLCHSLANLAWQIHPQTLYYIPHAPGLRGRQGPSFFNHPKKQKHPFNYRIYEKETK